MGAREEVISLAKREGASLVGIASTNRFDGAPQGHHPCELLPGARSVISFGIRLLGRVMEWPSLLEGSALIPEELRVVALRELFYKRSGYDIVNDRLNQIALTLANYLEDTGQRALFFPATYGGEPAGKITVQLPGMLSQRHAAVRAGLGEFGINNVVVTEAYGPRVRFNSVITTAELAPSPLLTGHVCLGSECRLCVDECPAGAFSLLEGAAGKGAWHDPVSRTSWPVCLKSQVETACMGSCLMVCPVGR